MTQDPAHLLDVLGWKKLSYQRLMNKAVLMYKTLHALMPAYLISKFIHRSETTTYNLRNTQMSLAMPQPRTNYAW